MKDKVILFLISLLSEKWNMESWSDIRNNDNIVTIRIPDYILLDKVKGNKIKYNLDEIFSML